MAGNAVAKGPQGKLRSQWSPRVERVRPTPTWALKIAGKDEKVTPKLKRPCLAE